MDQLLLDLAKFPFVSTNSIAIVISYKRAINMVDSDDCNGLDSTFPL